jgi:hypothetical protein
MSVYEIFQKSKKNIEIERFFFKAGLCIFERRSWMCPKCLEKPPVKKASCFGAVGF